MVITDECISCAACVEECEKGAIHNAGESYTYNGEEKAALSEDHTFIAPELCQDCGDCQDVCAVEAIQGEIKA
ncbi:MAG: 4Fe-4S binding protein [Ignavibacteria bacterium]|jgi:ferredoxin|nr:4Fe-4S binding protein [Ignavibacteria bacterium]MCU7501097.1 4Fe-4S binding protein [Ignavibacteria bacterium]MCU7513920.1 4Fe-4S binding protein [Ignavibacteria bacterium]MCU7522131.1 4Fe-4S binding protein [Ignavibacteria bacterium]